MEVPPPHPGLKVFLIDLVHETKYCLRPEIMTSKKGH